MTETTDGGDRTGAVDGGDGSTRPVGDLTDARAGWRRALGAEHGSVLPVLLGSGRL